MGGTYTLPPLGNWSLSPETGWLSGSGLTGGASQVPATSGLPPLPGTTTTPKVTNQTWTDPATGAVYNLIYTDGVLTDQQLLSAGKPPSTGGGTSPIGYGEPFEWNGQLWQEDSRGQLHNLGSAPSAPGSQIAGISGGNVITIGPDGGINFVPIPSQGGDNRQIVTNNQTGQQFWVDPTTGATEPVFGGSTYQSASPYLRASSGGGGNITSDAVNAIARLAAGASSGGGGSASAIDPNIQARQDAEINLMNKRFELDKTLKLIDLQIQLGLLDKQEGERMMDRAIQSAGVAANNRIDIANFNRGILNDKLNAAGQLSQQISDVNPAAFNAWLLGGGGVISNALAADSQGPLDELTALPAARTLQSIRQSVEAPAPYNPLEFLSQFQNAIPSSGSGIPGLDLAAIFGGVNPGDILGGATGGVPAAGGTTGGTTGGTPTGGGVTPAPLGNVTPSGGGVPAFGLSANTYENGKLTGTNTSSPLYNATNGGYISANGTYLSPEEGTALAEMLGVPTGIDPIGFRQTDLAANGDIVAGLQGRVQGITGGNPLFVDTGGTAPTINPNLFAGMSEFEKARAQKMLEAQGLGGWAGLATQPATLPSVPSNPSIVAGSPSGAVAGPNNVFYAGGTGQRGTNAQAFIVGERGPEMVIRDGQRSHVVPNQMLPMAMAMMRQNRMPGFADGTLDIWAPVNGDPMQALAYTAYGYARPTPAPAQTNLQTTTGANLSAGGQLQAPTPPPPPQNVTVQPNPALPPVPVPQPIVQAATQPPTSAPVPPATTPSQSDVITADPFTDIIMPGDQPTIDEILNLRRNTQLPGGVNPFAADLFQSVNPVTLASWLAALQTQKGIPSEAALWDLQRFAPAGVDISGIRTGV